MNDAVLPAVRYAFGESGDSLVWIPRDMLCHSLQVTFSQQIQTSSLELSCFWNAWTERGAILDGSLLWLSSLLESLALSHLLNTSMHHHSGQKSSKWCFCMPLQSHLMLPSGSDTMWHMYAFQCERCSYLPAWSYPPWTIHPAWNNGIQEQKRIVCIHRMITSHPCLVTTLGQVMDIFSLHL